MPKVKTEKETRTRAGPRNQWAGPPGGRGLGQGGGRGHPCGDQLPRARSWTMSRGHRERRGSSSDPETSRLAPQWGRDIYCCHAGGDLCLRCTAGLPGAEMPWATSLKGPQHGQTHMGFPGGSAGNVGDLGSIPGLGRSPGDGKGYPLQYSALENSMDYTVHGVAKSWTRLSNFHTTFILTESVQFSCSVVSNSLQPHESQHARPPGPSPTPRACSNSCPSSQ